MRRYSCAPQGISLRKMMCQCCGTFFLWQFVCSHHKVYHFCFTTHKLRCKLRVCLDRGNFKVKIQELENRGKEVQVFGTREMPIPFLRNSVARCSFHTKNKNPHRSLVFFFPSRAGGTCVTYTKTVNLLIPQEHVQFRHLCRFTHGGVMAMPSDYMNRPRDHWNMLLRCLLVSTTTSTDLPVAPFRPWPVGCYGPLLLLDSLDEERRWREN